MEAKVYIIGHPEQKPNEVFLGNLELDLRETENFGLVKEKTKLKTIRVGGKPYEYEYAGGELIRREINQFHGICDTFGPFPLFIGKSEFEEIKQKEKDITPEILFERIVERKTQDEALREKNKEFVGIIQIVDMEPYYTIRPPGDKSRPVLIESLQRLVELTIQKQGTDFENKITFEPPPVTPIHSAEFFRLSPMEKKFFMRQIEEILKIEKGNLN